MLNAELTQSLAVRVADVLETSDDDASSVEMGEMADGSRRHYALVTTYDVVNELEQVYRITTPASLASPDWARKYDEWATEVRVGDDEWLHLEEWA